MQLLVEELNEKGYVSLNEEQYNFFRSNDVAKELWQYSEVTKVNEDGTRIYLIMNDKGFSFKFWEEYIEAAKNGDITDAGNKAVRIDGAHYVICDDNCSEYIKGYGGREFVIEFIDGPHKGQVITTTNLWHQGTICKDYVAQLPDNAKFIRG